MGTAYPTRFPTAYPTRYPTRYPTTFPTSYPTPYPTAFPTPTCATTCSVKKHFNKEGGKFGKKIITVHDRDLIMYHHNHDQHRCYVNAAGKCKCVCRSKRGGSEQQFHRGALTGEKAAGHLTLAGYAEGTKYHKAISVFNDGCGNVNLGKYRIDIYHNVASSATSTSTSPTRSSPPASPSTSATATPRALATPRPGRRPAASTPSTSSTTATMSSSFTTARTSSTPLVAVATIRPSARTRPASVLDPASGPRLGTASTRPTPCLPAARCSSPSAALSSKSLDLGCRKMQQPLGCAKF